MFRRMYEGERLPVMEHIDVAYADKPMKCHSTTAGGGTTFLALQGR
jgi:hypothetical protein